MDVLLLAVVDERNALEERVALDLVNGGDDTSCLDQGFKLGKLANGSQNVSEVIHDRWCGLKHRWCGPCSWGAWSWLFTLALLLHT